MTFVAEMTKALAWPAAALAIFLALRKPLLGLIPLVQRLRFRDVELDFGRQVSELSALLRRELLGLPRAGAGRAEAVERLRRLAELSPRAVVLEAWLLLEEAAIGAGRRHNLPLTTREMRSPLLLGHYLEQAGLLDEGKVQMYHELRNLRNAAAHASELEMDGEAAMEYAELALRLAEFLEGRT